MAVVHHAKNSLWGLSMVLEGMGDMKYPDSHQEREALQLALSSLKPVQKHLHGCEELILGCQQLSELLEGPKSQEDKEQKARLMGRLWLKCGTVQQNAVSVLDELKGKKALKSGDRYDSGHITDIPINVILDALRRSYHPHSPNIQWDYDPTLVMHTDPELLEMALTNLINNALNHCPRGTEIVVSAKRYPWKHNRIQFVVSDKGPGIPPELRPLLFSRHKPKHSDPDKQYNTRVGMYITRQLVKAMGGNVKVRSESDKGTSISFILPLA